QTTSGKTDNGNIPSLRVLPKPPNEWLRKSIHPYMLLPWSPSIQDLIKHSNANACAFDRNNARLNVSFFAQWVSRNERVCAPIARAASVYGKPKQKTRWRCSMRPRHRNSCARGEPMIVILESYPELLVVHPQIAVSAARHDVRRDLHDLLRHDADVGLAAAVIAKAIEAKTIVQIAEKNDVMLEPDAGAPTPAATPAAATAAAGAHAATPAAAACAQATAAAAAAEAGMTSATAAMARRGAAMRRSRLGACALTATMCAFGTLTGTMAFAHIRAAAARPVAGLGAGPINAGTDSIAGFVAGLD